MPSVTNIVLNDAQATPVAHTFIPLGPDASGVWWYEDQSGTSPIGYNKVSLSISRPKPANVRENSGERNIRVKIGIHTPKLETLATSDSGLTPPPTVAYIPRFSAEFVMSERATLQDRRDLRKYADFIFSDAAVIAMVESLQSIY